MTKMVAADRLARPLQDAALKEALQRLRRTDNVTNLYYLARTYAYLALVLGGTVWAYHARAAAGLSWWWDVPVTLLAIVLVGAGQHQLAGLGHEAAHHTLLRHRLLNDLVSDWFCMFPLFSSTSHYRLQHLAHHQFVNDPVRDPDVAQLRASGHWLDFPLAPASALWALLRQTWPPRLLRYALIRSRYGSVALAGNPYARKDTRPPRWPSWVGIAYVPLLAVLFRFLMRHGDPVLMAVVPAVSGAALVAFYLLLPERLYEQLRLRPVVSLRWVRAGRSAFLTALVAGLGWTTWLTGEWAALCFLLLWVLPLFTSFAFFMILRQIVQHGNGGRGWLTNTRVFLVHRLVRFAVFPLGQDYHLPHHLFSTVPHYRLRQLHEALLAYPEYRAQAVVVHGYFLPPRPTVLDVLGPNYAPAQDAPVHIDNSVLENDEVLDRAGILAEVESSARAVEGPRA
jgi:fatty acid desaturase